MNWYELRRGGVVGMGDRSQKSGQNVPVVMDVGRLPEHFVNVI